MKPVVYRSLSALPSDPPGNVRVGQEAIPARFGVIGQIESTGYGIILDSEDQAYSFSFGAIEHYQGQSASTLAALFGLKKGQQVRFALVGDRVVLVQPYVQTQASAVATTDSGS